MTYKIKFLNTLIIGIVFSTSSAEVLDVLIVDKKISAKIGELVKISVVLINNSENLVEVNNLLQVDENLYLMNNVGIKQDGIISYQSVSGSWVKNKNPIISKSIKPKEKLKVLVHWRAIDTDKIELLFHSNTKKSKHIMQVHIDK